MNASLPHNTAPLPVQLRIQDYLLLDESGALDAYAKTELIDGEIVFMNAQHRPHAYAKMQFYDALRDALKAMKSSIVPLVEASIAMPDDSVPEPDIVLTSEPKGEGLIPLSSVALIVEVSDTTLDNDLGRKANLYARHSVPEYWVIDLNDRLIHQMWEPINGTYTQRREIRFGDHFTAKAIAGLEVGTKAL